MSRVDMDRKVRVRQARFTCLYEAWRALDKREGSTVGFQVLSPGFIQLCIH